MHGVRIVKSSGHLEICACCQENSEGARPGTRAAYCWPPPPCKRRKYIQADQRIETIVSDYANGSKVDYLRGLAHNIEINS